MSRSGKVIGPHPVTVCTKCGRFGHSVQWINMRCSAIVDGKRCKGTNGARTADGDWVLCNRCWQKPAQLKKHCWVCQGSGWRLAGGDGIAAARPVAGNAMTDGKKVLQGLRLLVVEDDLLVATSICDAVEDEGGIVVGPTARLTKALDLAEANELDGAVLDINLRGKMSIPLARLLARRGVPFLFFTAYPDAVLPQDLQAPLLGKPFDIGGLMKEIHAVVAKGAEQPRA